MHHFNNILQCLNSAGVNSSANARMSFLFAQDFLTVRVLCNMPEAGAHFACLIHCCRCASNVALAWDGWRYGRHTIKLSFIVVTFMVYLTSQ